MPSHLLISFVAYLFLLPLSLTTKCPSYICESNKLQNKQCSLLSYGDDRAIYSLKSCEALEACNRTTITLDVPNDCVKAESLRTRYPGEYATTEDSCIARLGITADKHICKGKAENQACEKHAECDAGLFCNRSSICEPVAKVNQTCINRPCESVAVCNDGFCVLMGSLDDGSPASAPFACQSFHILNGKCAAGPKLLTSDNKEANGPTLCFNQTTAGKCKYKYPKGGDMIEESCVCGRVDGKIEKGSQVCAAGAGDVDMKPFASYVAALQKSKSHCHFEKGPLCMFTDYSGLSNEYLQAYVARERLVRGHIYFNNSDCVKNVLNWEFYKIKDLIKNASGGLFGLYLFLFLAIGVVVAIAIVLVIIYCCRKSGDDDAITSGAVKLT